MSDVKKSEGSPESQARRALLRHGAGLGAAGAFGLALSRADASAPTDPGYSFVLPGESIGGDRMKAVRILAESNLKEIELLREFDPDEDEPVTSFRP
jgi:hypothetical protein